MIKLLPIASFNMYLIYMERYEALNALKTFESETDSLAVIAEKGELLIELNKFKKNNPTMFQPKTAVPKPTPQTAKVFELEKEIIDMNETVDDIQYDLRRFILVTILLNFLIFGVTLAVLIFLLLR